MKTHIIILWITAFGMTACHSRPQADTAEETIPQDTIAILDFASAINKEVPDTFTWNSVAKKVTYIPLSSSHLMDGHPAINYLGDDMCILSEGKEQWIHRVDFKGSFFKQFPTYRKRSRRICLPIFRGLSPERLHYSRF